MPRSVRPRGQLVYDAHPDREHVAMGLLVAMRPLAKDLEGKGNFGYNAQTGEYGDMGAMGVLYSTKVTRTALQNAASVSALILTTDAMVAELPKDEKASAMPGGMGGMGDMDM